MTMIAENSAELSREAAAGKWCVRLAGAPLSPAERAEFDTWLERDEENSRAYDQALSVWYGLHALGDTPELIGHRADALSWLQQEGRRRWMRPIKRPWGPLIAIAASIALLLTGLPTLMSGGIEQYHTALGERRTALLEDGTRLSLDADTNVSVDFEKERRQLILTEGRAKFDVAHDSTRPFTVEAAGRTIIATGTSFSVEVLKQDVRVVVYDGHVAVVNGKIDLPAAKRIVADRRAAAVRLEPGRELIADKTRKENKVLATDIARSLTWEGGQLDFVNEPLSVVAERLNRYSTTKIIMSDPKVSRMPINGVFNAGDTDAFLSALDTAYPVSIRRSGDQATVELQSH